MRVLNRHFLLGVLFVTALAWCIQASACDCTKPANYGNKQCAAKITAALNNPTGVSNANNNTAMGGAGGRGGNGGAGGSASSQSGSQAAASAAALATSSASVGNTTASGGSATANASNGGNVQSTTDVVQRSAPPVSLGVIAPNGCGAGAQGGGSNTRGAMMAGFAWTTSECYAFILAQSYQAIGQLRAACELLNTTNAAKRAAARGFVLPSCEPEVREVTRVVTSQFPGTYTKEQVDAIVRKAVSK